jgi:hypothetical protein
MRRDCWCFRSDFRLSWVRERPTFSFFLFSFVFFLLPLGLASDVHCCVQHHHRRGGRGADGLLRRGFCPICFHGLGMMPLPLALVPSPSPSCHWAMPWTPFTEVAVPDKLSRSLSLALALSLSLTDVRQLAPPPREGCGLALSRIARADSARAEYSVSHSRASTLAHAYARMDAAAPHACYLPASCKTRVESIL